MFDDPSDYADPDARLSNPRTYSWMHPIGEIVTSIIAAGMSLRWLHEHDQVPWRMFEALVEDGRRHVPLARRSRGCRWPSRCAPSATASQAAGRGCSGPADRRR